ncbi:hypothetical protein [Cryobacterium sp. Y50]|uniref:hypothetical protein n=1 Tax=Cryobacterium sp. Y50 TaxID=2048286 RepID=UPI0011B0E9F7|nr:hypothetical protein [Cryobacterium sp. Y50]
MSELGHNRRNVLKGDPVEHRQERLSEPDPAAVAVTRSSTDVRDLAGNPVSTSIWMFTTGGSPRKIHHGRFTTEG